MFPSIISSKFINGKYFRKFASEPNYRDGTVNLSNIAYNKYLSLDRQ